MGLTYVQSVIRSMGGWTAVRSTEGKGTSIRLFLPKARIARIRRRGRAETRGQTVLVVDDKAEILSAVRKSLEQAGYKVLTADNAEDGLLLYRKHGADISLSIVDAVMKGQWGDAVVREIVTHRPEANVIMTSGFSQDYVRGLLPLGAWSFLQKPFTGEQLIAAIREAIGLD
jgi:DNA-binding NtrC family response regulator